MQVPFPSFKTAFLRMVWLLACIAYGAQLSAQDIVGVSARFADSFAEWIILTDDEYRDGELVKRWRGNENWAEWDFRLGDTLADISLKWREDPNLWQIRCLGTVVTARTMWRDNFLEWRISDGTDSFVWRSRYGNVFDEWVIRESSRGSFSVYTYWEGNPRDWVVADELDPEVSYAMRITMIFIAVFHSTPKI